MMLIVRGSRSFQLLPIRVMKTWAASGICIQSSVMAYVETESMAILTLKSVDWQVLNW
jgi:hypothetical protein